MKHATCDVYSPKLLKASSLLCQERVILVLRVFFVFLDKRSELSRSFIEASSVIGRKIKYLQAKQRTCQNMQGLRS